MKKKMMFHGEVCIVATDSIPSDAKKISTKKNRHFVLAPSEHSGNDHRISVLEDTEIYERDGVIYVSAPAPTEVFCPNLDRHGKKTLPAGTWKVKKAMQFDCLKQELEAVRD